MQVQADSYYEPSSYVLSLSVDHRQSPLASDGLWVDGKLKDLDEQIEDLKQAQTTHAGPAKLDTYLCEFHHNISPGRKKYAPEDVTVQVRKLVDAEVVAAPFTVAIDTTIAKTDEDAVKNFLSEFKKEIAGGQMNVVIYRSVQKFDQLGGDMYNGGIMCVISAKPQDESSPFQRALDGRGEEVSEGNFQGLTHLNLSAQKELNDYRAAIARNTSMIGNPESGSKAAIPAEMLLKDENKALSMLQIAVNKDEIAPFIDIRFPFGELGKEPDRDTPEHQAWRKKRYQISLIYRKVLHLFAQQTARDPESSVISFRASFGFQHTNAVLINGEKLRLTPGLEDEDRLAKHTETLKSVNDVMMMLKADLDGETALKENAFETIAASSQLISAETIDAHRAFRDVEAGSTSTVEQKDEARLRMVRAFCASPKLLCANPPRTLRLIDAMSEVFWQSHAAELAKLYRHAMKSLGEIKVKDMMSARKQLFEVGAFANRTGNVRLVEQKLSKIRPLVKSILDQVRLEHIERWCRENEEKLDERSEQRLTLAERCRDLNDARGVREALKGEFPEDYIKLRGRLVEDLRGWATKIYSENGTQAQNLLENIEMCMELGQRKSAGYYVEKLEDMIKEKVPGLSDNLKDVKFPAILKELNANTDVQRG